MYGRPRPYSSNSQLINISDDLDTDMDASTERIHRKSSADELNILDQANSSMSLADELRVSPPDSGHPFRQHSPLRSRSSAQDGPSTVRLRKLHEKQAATAPLSAASSGSKSRAASPPETVDSDVNEIEEIETFTSPESYSKAPVTTNLRRPTSPKGVTVFAPNNVQKKIEVFEPKPKPKLQEYDLKAMSLKRGLANGMKSKSGSLASVLLSLFQP